MKKPQQYIVVDDDTTNNLICEYLIKNYDPGAQIRTFTTPEAALEFIRSQIDLSLETVLFIDLNMPTMSGWDFLAEVQKMESGVIENVRSFILSSSIEDFSERGEKFPYVSGFLSKPLSKTRLIEIAEGRSKEEI